MHLAIPIRLALSAQRVLRYFFCSERFPSPIAMEAESLLGGVGSAANIEQVCGAIRSSLFFSDFIFCAYH
jgi:hypothetical protein